MKHEALRDSLVQQAEASFIVLSTQIDLLMDSIGFYLDRYPSDGSASNKMVSQELATTVNNLASLVGQMADTVNKWKVGASRVLSKAGTELNVINELVANVRAVQYFLASHDIDPDPFDQDRFEISLVVLARCNTLLT